MTRRSPLAAMLDGLGAAVAAVVRRSSWMRCWYVPVTAAGLTAIAIVAVFRMESTVPNYDPQYMRVLVERTMEQGGSYYANGIHNKGPLEPLLYEVAGHLGGRAGWWFVLAAMALAAAVAVGLAAAVVAVRAGSSVTLAVCVAVVAVVHLTLSDADYAGVLYARNITTTLIAVALGVAAHDGLWDGTRTRRRAAVVVGVACGLAVQTLVTAVFTAAPVLVWAMWERRDQRIWGRPAWLVMPAVAAAAFLSAPLAYLVTGSWQDFVDGFWTYARFMSTGTGLDLSQQLRLGWDQFRTYYGDRPELVALIAAWSAVAGARWGGMSRRLRGLHLVVLLWWFGAWVELVLSQRYSSHYFSVLAVPTIMMIALMVGGLAPVVRSLARPAFALLPLLVAYVTIDLDGRSGFDVGIETAAVVRSTDDFEERREAGIDGRTRMLRATLDLVSEDGDPLLTWTSFPWPYLSLHRTSATRYIWSTFLLGEIYLGRSGPEYVLPGTWERFAADVDDTDPVAYYVETVNPIAPDTPFRRVVDARFTDVFADGHVTLGLRDDLAQWLAEPVTGGVPLPAVGAEPLTLAPDGCVRLDGRLDVAGPGVITIHAVAEGGGRAGMVVVPDGAGLLVRTIVDGRDDWLRRIVAPGSAADIALVAGERAVVLTVDGQVAGAVEVEPGTPVQVIEGVAALTRHPATLSEPPAFTGC